jgi:hypothetical protein
MKKRETDRRRLLVLLSLMSVVSAAGAASATAIISSPSGLFHGEARLGPDPVHPTMVSFKLYAGAGRVIWEDNAFGQNACWVAGDGRTVVGLRSAGVEGLPGVLTFYGQSGQKLRQVAILNFSGGCFTAKGDLFIFRSGDRGIAALDRAGTEVWSVASGSQYVSSDDGKWLAVVRGRELAVYHEGRPWGAIALDSPFVEDLSFVPGEFGLRFRTPSSETEYDLTERQLKAIQAMHPRRITPPARAEARSTVIWPIDSVNAVHPLGNGWGEYQWYGGSPYLHPGIDVMALTDTGVPVYAVAHGWVKAWLTTSGDWHWRLAIADSSLAFSDSCDGWLYAHIDSGRTHAAMGQEVFPGDQIGYLVPWPVTGFDHLHFARIRDAGAVWGPSAATWEFQDSPLNHLAPNGDPEPPVIEPALAGSKFAYCRDNTSQYLPPGNLTGDVDIIARIYDRFGPPIPYYSEWEKLNPFRVEYAVHGAGDSVPRTTAFLFSHFLPYGDLGVVNAVFKQDDSCVTYGDYDDRQYYYILTNTDGDTTLEATDVSGRWRTTDLPDGHYWVVVYASDHSGNVTADSQLVTVNNYGGVAGFSASAGRTGQLWLEASPSPFITKVFLSIDLSAPGRVIATIYNPLGERVASLDGGWLQPGRHRLVWDGRDEGGKAVPAGTYFVKAESGGGKAVSRLIRLR